MVVVVFGIGVIEDLRVTSRNLVVGGAGAGVVLAAVALVLYRVSRRRDEAIEIDYEKREVRFFDMKIEERFLARRSERVVKSFDQILTTRQQAEHRGIPGWVLVTLDRGTVKISEFFTDFLELHSRLIHIGSQTPDPPFLRRGGFVFNLLIFAVVFGVSGVVLWLAWVLEWV